ncbi:MAG: 6-carboxytetrahydropterin synthase QueD [Candidatus Firestonebacteria bacterium GWA2_43_8]|nr:MAG: 6-carboxytetrahydropterin synthase QueD [Candidatus Firestonebacteria bacterium GWA2_43_8]
MFELNVEDEFASAHYLRGYKGKCERVHGHNYRVMITVKAKVLNKIGLAVDFTELKVELKKVMEILDHNLLDELPYFKKINPSAENIAKYIYDSLSKPLKARKVKLYKVTVWETARASASYTNE